jgi:hypothetical protein
MGEHGEHFWGNERILGQQQECSQHAQNSGHGCHFALASTTHSPFPSRKERN